MISKEVETSVTDLYEAKENAKAWRRSAEEERRIEKEHKNLAVEAERRATESEAKVHDVLIKLAELVAQGKQSLTAPPSVGIKPTIEGPEYLGREEA